MSSVGSLLLAGCLLGAEHVDCLDEDALQFLGVIDHVLQEVGLDFKEHACHLWRVVLLIHHEDVVE